MRQNTMNLIITSRRNILSYILLTGCLISAYIIAQLQIYWLDLVFVVIIVWFLSMWATLLTSHKFVDLLKTHQTINKFNEDYFEASNELSKDDLSSVDALVADIEKYCFSNWFPKITKDVNFIENSKVNIRDVLKKILKAQTPSHSKLLIYGMLNIYLKHLREYKRSLDKKKLHEGQVTDLYRYSHVCSNSSDKYDYFIYHLTLNFLNRFTNWELRNSLPCHVADSVVARKLVNHILKMMSDPKCINYFILKFCVSKQVDNYSYVIISDEEFLIQELKGSENTKIKCSAPIQTESKDSVLVQQIPNTTVKSKEKESAPSVNKESNLLVFEEQALVKTAMVKPPGSPKHLTVAHNKNSQNQSAKKLAYLRQLSGGEKSENTTCHSKEKAAVNTGIPDMGTKKLLNEVKSSIKPLSGATMNTFQSIKDLHHTTFDNVMKPVSQATSSALHKIGDLQDEAADVVEGIIDFGKAGICKGLLQFSAFQEQQTAKLESLLDTGDSTHHAATPGKVNESQKVLDKSSPFPLDSNDSEEYSMKSHEETPQKQSSCDSTDESSFDKDDIKPPKFLPVISMNLLESTESPDPEYEETADLATTIAKLRTLLQQKSSESSMSTPAVSPMPPDEFGSDNVFERENIGSYPDEDNGVMPSFYKFCAKTATGVLHNTLNTIKTALPSSTIDGECLNTNNWSFIEIEESGNLLERMNKLLFERKAFCTVDNAFEAIESLKETDDPVFPCILHIEDDLDDFETKIPVSKLLMDILCELMLETDSVLIQEPVIKLCLLLFGHKIEKQVVEHFNYYIKTFITTYRYTPDKKVGETMNLALESYVQILRNCLPSLLIHSVGDEAIDKAFKLLISSLQYPKMNEDMLLQMCELICLSFTEDGSDL